MDKFIQVYLYYKLLNALCQFRIMYQVFPLKTSKCYKSRRLSALPASLCCHTGPVGHPCVVQHFHPMAQSNAIFAQIPHQRHQPTEVARRADDLFRRAFPALLPLHCQHDTLFLQACVIAQRVCALIAFAIRIGPGLTAVLFRNHMILPPILFFACSHCACLVDISHAL